MAIESIEYRGYNLEMVPEGNGYKIVIRQPGALFALPQMPFSPDKSQLGRLIVQARAVVDAVLDDPKAKK